MENRTRLIYVPSFASVRRIYLITTALPHRVTAYVKSQRKQEIDYVVSAYVCAFLVLCNNDHDLSGVRASMYVRQGLSSLTEAIIIVLADLDLSLLHQRDYLFVEMG